MQGRFEFSPEAIKTYDNWYIEQAEYELGTLYEQQVQQEIEYTVAWYNMVIK